MPLCQTVTSSELETDEELEKQDILVSGFNSHLTTLAQTGCFDFKGYPDSKVKFLCTKTFPCQLVLNPVCPPH